MKAFIHIPKTGGQSVWSVLREQNPWICLDKNLQSEGYLIGHQRALEGYKHPDTDYLYAIVRNPYDKLVSSFFFTQKHNSVYIADTHMNNHMISGDFEQFVLTLDLNKICEHLVGIYYQPQYKFIEQYEVDKIYKFESITDVEAELGQSIPHINRSEHKPYQEYYTQEMKDIVYSIYEKDFTLFNYDK